MFLLNESGFTNLIDTIASYNHTKVVLISTFISTLFSIPLVYICVLFFGEEYGRVYLALSIILPILITPGMIALVLMLATKFLFIRKHLEEELQKKDKILFEQARFILMGEMMANISHQWKQPLNTISLAVVTAKTSDASKEQSERYFDIIEDNVNYLASTINDFMSFFDKRSSVEMRSLNNLVKEIQSIIETRIKNKQITLEIEFDAKCEDSMIASPVSHVILNLLNNAVDAFEGLQNEHKKIALRFVKTKEGMEIECCDNGNGIDKELQTKIFEPYFTTKRKKKGTGIGLYMSKEIVEKMFTGSIVLGEKNDYPTCFIISLPYSKNCALKK